MLRPNVLPILIASLLCVLVPRIEAAADDWPTHLHDTHRSGNSAEQLGLPLHRHWERSLSPPKPAWPEPAEQDYWHRKTKLQSRVTFDRAYGIVSTNGKVVFGSSADDQVRCLDAETGGLNWTFYAEAPVRLAPTIWQGIVVFGADDGFVYGLDLESGDLRWKTRPDEVGTRRIPGNERIISERPIRTDVLIEDRTAYFAAGLFPQQGTYFFSLDPRNGKILDRAQLDRSPQGYLEQRDGQVYAPTGRDPRGVYLRNLASSRNIRTNQLASKLKDEETYAIIADRDHVYCGRDNLVLAFADDQEEPVWSADVPGRPYALAIAEGALFVSTDRGTILRFGAEPRTPILHRTQVVKREPRKLADRYLKEISNSSGYALVVEPTDWELPLALRDSALFQVVVATKDTHQANRWRSEGITVHIIQGDLPYANKIFNLIIGGEQAEVTRLLVPGHGVAFCGDTIVRCPAPEKTGAWTHMYADAGNTGCSNDPLGDNLRLQWFGRPGPKDMVDRHMRTMPSLATHGRLFVPGLDRIIAVDAHNGTIQWEKSLPGSTRIGILKDCGYMVANQDSLYVARGPECLLLEAATGAVIQTATVPTEDRDWGYLALVGDDLIGSTTRKNASRRTINREAILEGAYTDNRPFVCSDSLFVLDRTLSAHRWTYECRGAILNASLAANAKSLYFLESIGGALNSENNGRLSIREFMDGHPELACLDIVTGKVAWRKSIELEGAVQGVHVIATDEHVICVNSRNEETVHYDIRVFDALNGQQLWSASQDNQHKIGGDHGEQDKHPVLIGKRLIVEPQAYDLENGEIIADFGLRNRGYGCGTLSASAKTLFFRSGNPASMSLETNMIVPVTKVSRPGCWINMIPASGLLLVPEASAGCTCAFPIQTSMGFTSE